MNTRDKYLLELAKKNQYYATAPIIREMVIDECLAELAKYAFATPYYNAISKLKAKRR